MTEKLHFLNLFINKNIILYGNYSSTVICRLCIAECCCLTVICHLCVCCLLEDDTEQNETILISNEVDALTVLK